MTRSEYFSRLDKLLQCIDSEEREAALRYYNEYFDDAGADNEAEVMAELGTPEELARNIIVQTVNEKESAQKESAPQAEFDGFTSINVDVINAKVTVRKGAEYAVDITRSENASTKIEAHCANSTLFINEEMKVKKLFRNFINGAHKPAIIEITVPDIRLNDIKAENVNGSITLSGLEAGRIGCEIVNGSMGAYDCNADSMHLECVNGSVAAMNCAVTFGCNLSTVNGSATVAGNHEGRIKAESVNGTLRIATGRPISLFNADLSTISGSIFVNDVKQKGRSVTIKSNAALHSISANTINGSIRLEFAE